MSKVIFLLGAGASHDAKLPLMAELTAGFPEWLATATTVEDRERDRLLFDAAVKAVSPAGAPNIEVVLSLIGSLSSLKVGPAAQVITKWQAPFDGPPHDLAVLAADIREYISARLRRVNPKDGEYLSGLLDFHDSEEPLDVFTMNYDRLVESMAARFGARFTTGFGDVWDPGLFAPDNDWDMRVFKLHGSVDWYRLPGRSMIFQGSKEHYAFPDEPPVEVLLYPAEGKEAYAEPYATLMSMFTQALSKAQFCVAVGYSFRDAHIRRTVLDRLVTNPSLQLLIVNPSAHEVISLPREKHDEPSFRDFPDRVAGLWVGAKQAFEDRLIGYRLYEMTNADSLLKSVVQRRSRRDFPTAAAELVDAVERCRGTQLPNKPYRILRQVTGDEFRRALAVALSQRTNFLARVLGLMDSGIHPFPNAGERQPAASHGGVHEYLGTLVSCWLLASALSFEDEAERITDSINQLVLQNVRGLLILEDGKYVSWPDVLDPGKDPTKVVAERAATLRGFADELHNWPPQSALGLVEGGVAQRYEALERGLTALSAVYQAMSDAGVRRIRMEPRHSIFGIAPLHAWRVMLLKPLGSTPLSQPFAALQKSGFVAAWLSDPVLTGSPATLADL